MTPGLGLIDLISPNANVLLEEPWSMLVTVLGVFLAIAILFIARKKRLGEVFKQNNPTTWAAMLLCTVGTLLIGGYRQGT